ncbi:MAG: hypothetical protein GY793_00080 [Proteobacteria bacterium]|nr:hypothetical protein [Pseudomonadota bacterium]
MVDEIKKTDIQHISEKCNVSKQEAEHALSAMGTSVTIPTANFYIKALTYYKNKDLIIPEPEKDYEKLYVLRDHFLKVFKKANPELEHDQAFEKAEKKAIEITNFYTREGLKIIAEDAKILFEDETYPHLSDCMIAITAAKKTVEEGPILEGMFEISEEVSENEEIVQITSTSKPTPENSFNDILKTESSSSYDLLEEDNDAEEEINQTIEIDDEESLDDDEYYFVKKEAKKHLKGEDLEQFMTHCEDNELAYSSEKMAEYVAAVKGEISTESIDEFENYERTYHKNNKDTNEPEEPKTNIVPEQEEVNSGSDTPDVSENTDDLLESDSVSSNSEEETEEDDINNDTFPILTTTSSEEKPAPTQSKLVSDVESHPDTNTWVRKAADGKIYITETETGDKEKICTREYSYVRKNPKKLFNAFNAAEMVAVALEHDNNITIKSATLEQRKMLASAVYRHNEKLKEEYVTKHGENADMSLLKLATLSDPNGFVALYDPQNLTYVDKIDNLEKTEYADYIKAKANASATQQQPAAATPQNIDETTTTAAPTAQDTDEEETTADAITTPIAQDSVQQEPTLPEDDQADNATPIIPQQQKTETQADVDSEEDNEETLPVQKKKWSKKQKVAAGATGATIAMALTAGGVALNNSDSGAKIVDSLKDTSSYHMIVDTADEFKDTFNAFAEKIGIQKAKTLTAIQQSEGKIAQLNKKLDDTIKAKKIHSEGLKNTHVKETKKILKEEIQHCNEEIATIKAAKEIENKNLKTLQLKEKQKTALEQEKKIKRDLSLNKKEIKKYEDVTKEIKELLSTEKKELLETTKNKEYLEIKTKKAAHIKKYKNKPNEGKELLTSHNKKEIEIINKLIKENAPRLWKAQKDAKTHLEKAQKDQEILENKLTNNIITLKKLEKNIEESTKEANKLKKAEEKRTSSNQKSFKNKNNKEKSAKKTAFKKAAKKDKVQKIDSEKLKKEKLTLEKDITDLSKTMNSKVNPKIEKEAGKFMAENHLALIKKDAGKVLKLKKKRLAEVNKELKKAAEKEKDNSVKKKDNSPAQPNKIT